MELEDGFLAVHGCKASSPPFHRTVRLSKRVIDSDIKASFTQGVLTLVIMKPVAVATTKIELTDGLMMDRSPQGGTD